MTLASNILDKKTRIQSMTSNKVTHYIDITPSRAVYVELDADSDAEVIFFNLYVECPELEVTAVISFNNLGSTDKEFSKLASFVGNEEALDAYLLSTPNYCY